MGVKENMFYLLYIIEFLYNNLLFACMILINIIKRGKRVYVLSIIYN